ncbi:MAG: tetratricopeptide repeat protein [Candidatus Thermoplasmatota archaeon]
MTGEPKRNGRENISSEAEKYIKRGKEHLDLGQYDEAINELEKATSLDPENVRVWTQKGDAHLAKREYSQARDCYERALLLDVAPEWIYWYKKGFVYKEERKMKKAKDCFEKTLNTLLSDSNFRYDMKKHVFVDK